MNTHAAPEEARQVIGEFIERDNRAWLLERHGYRTPAEVRRALTPAGGVIKPPTCLGNRDRYSSSNGARPLWRRNAISRQSTVVAPTVTTGMPGIGCDVLTGGPAGTSCAATSLGVDSPGVIQPHPGANWAIALDPARRMERSR